ncbi:transposase [Holospora obtusa]|uniref:transposase n=1 Tax=Holospora obtusa TaxID=49893 RepID=UPI00138ABF53
MDNYAFHRSQKTKKLIEFVACQLLFLSLYSPDLNPIEKLLAHMKRWVTNQINQFDKLYEAIAVFFQILFSC